MTLYWVLFGAIVFCALFNWRRTVIAWIPFSMLFNEAVCLKYTSPAVSFGLAVDVSLLFLYYVFYRYRKSYRQIEETTTYFFRPIFIAYLSSYLLSMIFSIVPLFQVFSGTIKYFIQSFVVVYLFQLALQTKEDISFFIKCLLVSFVLISLVAVFESLYRINPILSYIYVNAPSPDDLFGKMYFNPLDLDQESGDRFGRRRVFSFFSIHIGYGCASVMWFFLILYLILNKKRYHDYFKTSYCVLLLLLCLLGIMFSNSKTPMIGLLFFVLSVIKTSYIFKPKVFNKIIIICLLVIILFPSYLNNFIALFNQNVAEEGGGSDLSMRQRQFEVGWNLFLQNPIFGNGIGSIKALKEIGESTDILGSESSWLKILPQQGLFGAVVYLYMYSYLYIKLKNIIPQKTTLFFLGGLFVMEAVTGFMDFYIVGSIIIVIFKLFVIEKKEKYGNKCIGASLRCREIH